MSVLLAPEFYETRTPLFYNFVKSLYGRDDWSLLLGILALIVGVFKVLSPVYGDILIFGDLIPALGNLGGGTILILERLKGSQNFDVPILRVLNSILIARKSVWGIGCLLAAIIHFFLPKMVFF